LNDILFKNFKARSIGPATMGGRLSDIAIDPRNTAIFFVGLSTGGLFKTGDNGVTFDAVFDKQPVQSIGAIAIAPSDSDCVWVGTGEPTDRNRQSGRMEFIVPVMAEAHGSMSAWRTVVRLVA
jgi:hypothetical protein